MQGGDGTWTEQGDVLGALRRVHYLAKRAARSCSDMFMPWLPVQGLFPTTSIRGVLISELLQWSTSSETGSLLNILGLWLAEHLAIVLYNWEAWKVFFCHQEPIFLVVCAVSF